MNTETQLKLDLLTVSLEDKNKGNVISSSELKTQLATRKQKVLVNTILTMEAFMKEVGVFSAWEENKEVYLLQGEEA